MEVNNAKFTTLVCELVRQIPSGRVMTYGQIAALCGSPRSARVVGGIAHFGDPSLPWHRVVNKNGCLASGYPGGKMAHKFMLESDDVAVDQKLLKVDVAKLIWKP